MKHKIILLLRIPAASLLVGIIVFRLWQGGAFLSRDAEVSSDRVIRNGISYSPAYGDYTEGRIIAKGVDADWTVNAVEEDPTHTFIVARSFLDQYLMVSDDYTIPTSGAVTVVSWNGNYISDPQFLDVICKIDAEKTTSFTYDTDGIEQFTEQQQMRRLYFAYEGCPVATDFRGYLGKINGAWVMTADISREQRNEDGSPKPYSVGCYTIPDQYGEILSEYFE